MAAQQTLPAQAHGDRFGAQEILVAEAGVFRKSYRLCFQRRTAPQTEIVASDFHGPAENRLQPPGDALLQPSVRDQQRNSDVGEPEQHQKQCDKFRNPGPRAPWRSSQREQRLGRDGFGECIGYDGHFLFATRITNYARIGC